MAGHGVGVGVVGQPERDRVLPGGLRQLVDRDLEREHRRCFVRPPHVSRRLRVGSDQALLAREVGNAVKAGCGLGVEGGEQVVAGGLLIDLVDRCRQPARVVGAEPDAVPAGGAEAALVEGLRSGHHELDRPAEPAGRDGERADVRLEGVLLPEPASGVRGDHLDVGGVDAELPGQPVAHGPGVLGALVHDKNLPTPFDDTPQQLHRIHVRLRVLVHLVDPHLAPRERGLGVAQGDVGEERNRLLLAHGRRALVVEVHRDRFDGVRGAHEIGRLRGCHLSVRHDERDRLAPVGNVVAEQRLEALDGMAAGHEVPGCLQL